MLSNDDFTKYTVQSHNMNDHCLDDQNFVNAIPFPSALSTATSGGLTGQLGLLPLELLHSILNNLDLESLAALLAVNRAIRSLVLSLSYLQIIAQYAPHIWKAATAIRARRWLNLRDVYETMHHSTCEGCGDNGSYLYLLTCTRVCYLCFSRDKQFLPLGGLKAVRETELKRQEIESLPNCHTIAGTYSPSERKHNKSRFLVDRRAAEAALQNRRSQAVVTRRTMSGARRSTGLPPITNASSSSPDSPQQSLELGFDDVEGNVFRYATIVQVVSLDPRTHQVQRLRHCLACSQGGDIHDRQYSFRRIYDIHNFERHIHDCRQIQHDPKRNWWRHQQDR
ncbi:hypothetical protein BDZ85DRAFT_256888 [Elsinoe ampelina]|uniref:F-box domain-containing protein n=1 Tax=Elsinoe ampelina TaxID=302913 RepID=A0A6A6GM79_9PEZI|nr:hypothetical protein BDZ85DRAFT_256888 [Elsinoe ampelina]